MKNIHNNGTLNILKEQLAELSALSSDCKIVVDKINETILKLENELKSNNKEDIQLHSESYFKFLLENQGEGLGIVDLTGKFVFTNTTADKLFGFEKGGLVGHNLNEFISDEGFSNYKEKVKKRLKNEKSVYETEITSKDNVKRQLLLTVTAQQDANNIIIGSIGVFRDITHSKQIQEKLISSENKYKNLFENSPMPMWIYCIETYSFLEVNNSAIQHYGYSKTEFLNMTLFDITPEEDFISLTENITRYTKEKHSSSGLWKHITKEGKLIDVEIISHSIEYEGKKVRLVLANDVTEKKNIESVIANERILLRTLIDNIPDAVYVKDKQAKKLIVNKADLINIGIELEKDVIGRTDFELFPYSIAQKFYENDMDVIKNAHPIINHIEYLRTNLGTEKWLSTSKIPLFDDKGQTIGLIGIGRDITLQKQAEKKILQLTKGIEQNPAAIVLTDLNGNIEYVNAKFTEVSGYTQEEIIGLNPRILKSGHTPNTEYENLWNTIKAGNEWHGELLNKKKNGELFWESALISPIRDENGLTINYIGIKEDITSKKKNELELLKLSVGIEQSPTSIVITNIEGIIEYVNRKFIETSGYSFEELKGNILRIFINDLKDENLLNILSQEKEWHGEHLNKRKNHEYYWESVLIAPIKDNDGITVNYIVISEDITQRKTMENELIAAKEKAEEGDRLKTAFLNNMSHEIRTPLNAIVGFTSLLSDKELSADKQNTFISIVQRSSDQLLSIISDIMNISTIEAGQLRAYTKVVNINILLDGLYSQFQIKINKEIEFVLHKGLTDKNANIETDETKLTQIISNLLVNALKFTTKGKISFGYTLNEDELVFKVVDTGIGIDKEVHQHIFERFRQADLSTGQKYGGNGLGLSIAKSYVELLGGKIYLESAINEGSTFIFTLPYHNNK